RFVVAEIGDLCWKVFQLQTAISEASVTTCHFLSLLGPWSWFVWVESAASARPVD
ncbi:hypothetical protein NDU88_003528, partial [Pleurodeles waltl]